MKAHVMSMINAYTLIIMGAWGYWDSSAKTALIPVIFGVLILILNNGVKHDNKAQAHVVVILTLLVTIALFAKPLPAAMAREDTMSIIRVGLMVLTSLLAFYAFIKSFMAARKNK